MHFENIIYLPGKPKGRHGYPSIHIEKGGDNMSTYEELSLIISAVGLVIAILMHHDNKK